MSTLSQTKRQASAPHDAASDGQADYLAWLSAQSRHLREGRYEAIDALAIAEELDDMGRAERHRLRAALKVLLTHMLKWDQQPEKRSRSLLYSIREQRRRITRMIEESPGLKADREAAIGATYPDAVAWAALEIGCDDSEMPTAFPYDWSDVMERPFALDAD